MCGNVTEHRCGSPVGNPYYGIAYSICGARVGRYIDRMVQKEKNQQLDPLQWWRCTPILFDPDQSLVLLVIFTPTQFCMFDSPLFISLCFHPWVMWLVVHTCLISSAFFLPSCLSFSHSSIWRIVYIQCPSYIQIAHKSFRLGIAGRDGQPGQNH